MAKARSGMTINIEDGIIEWFDGPEWDDVAAEEFEKAAGEVEAYAKANAIWSDRTGDARAKLRAWADHYGNVVSVTLSHGVDYGFWLEVIQNGRFAIIRPTIEAESRRVTYNAIRRIRYARKMGKV